MCFHIVKSYSKNLNRTAVIWTCKLSSWFFGRNAWHSRNWRS